MAKANSVSLVWKKFKTGRLTTVSGRTEFVLKPAGPGWYRLLVGGRPAAEGTKGFCKDRAADVASRVGKAPKPGAAFGTSVGTTREKGESTAKFFRRMAFEHGYSPAFVAAQPYVLRDAGIDRAELTPAFIKTMTRETWPIAQKYAKNYNIRARKKVPGYYGTVEVKKSQWFKDPTDPHAFESADDRMRRVFAQAAASKTAAGGNPAAGGKGVDEFGMRLGSRAARINATVTDEPKSMKQLMKDAQHPVPFHGHMNKLIARGFVTKTDDGKFMRKPKDSPPRPKKKAKKGKGRKKG